MTCVGINGFGRIGKCCFLQLIDNKDFIITCINATNIKISEIEDYLKYDSAHVNYNKNFTFKIISENEFSVNHHKIRLFSDRNPKNIPWRQNGCSVVIEATGSFLTTEKCKQHDVDHVIITSPAKDDTPTYIYGVNHDKYNGESIVSASSCTTNCLAPILSILSNKYNIKSAIFTTIHASTASQYVVDVANKSARTSRSALNNIIPHTTGASSSISFVLPELKDKIAGTSVRVPTLNCSLLDLNIELEENIKLDEILNDIKSSEYYKTVYDISYKKLVSCDFMTTSTPCIVDANASIDIGNGVFKFMLWYDNEWSYSAQIIRLMREIYENKKTSCKKINEKFFVENVNLTDKKVVCRFDYNVPMKNGIVIDDFRISSTIETIKYIISQKPKYIVLVSHLGRPKGIDKSKSLQIIIPILESYLNTSVTFLEDGLSDKTIHLLNENENDNENNRCRIYLLENIRFHKEETEYEKMTDEEINNNKVFNLYKDLGNVYVSDAFGCMHRKHMSVHSISKFDSYAYGYLVKKELNAISCLIDKDLKKLVIIGGNKASDKIPIINLMKKVENTTVFVGGALATLYNSDPKDTNVMTMTDGYGNRDLESDPQYINSIDNCGDFKAYDIGNISLNLLFKLISEHDIIFWNGSLGVIEHEFYKKGSLILLELLSDLSENKKIIIGGGETSTLVNKTSNIYISTGGGALLECIENMFNNKNYLICLEIFQ